MSSNIDISNSKQPSSDDADWPRRLAAPSMYSYIVYEWNLNWARFIESLIISVNKCRLSMVIISFAALTSTSSIEFFANCNKLFHYFVMQTS